MLKKLLFKIAKGPFMGKIVGTAFQYCSWALPVKKVYNGGEVIAFDHPQPSYEHHIIISPKRAIQNLQQMKLDGSDKYFVKIWEAIEEIRAARPEYSEAFAIVVNGGRRQEVQQVHFHMFTDHEIVNAYSAREQEKSIFFRDADICILEHPDPNWEVHFVVKPVSPSRMAENEEYKCAYFRSILHGIDLLNDEFKIVQRGYSLVYQFNHQISDPECPVFHIVAGKKWK